MAIKVDDRTKLSLLLLALAALAYHFWLTSANDDEALVDERMISSELAFKRPEHFQSLEALPPELEPYRAKLETTKLQAIGIVPRRGRAELWESKYRGRPYLPKGAEYPRNPEGRPLAFLAQLNFAETPGLEDYPTAGILQFFISDGDVWGLRYAEPYDEKKQRELNTEQKYFALRYYPDVTKDEAQLTTDFTFLPKFDYLPVNGMYQLSFVPRTEYASPLDYRFTKLLGEDVREKLSDQSYARFDAAGNKIGGYASFAQQDPRSSSAYEGDWLLLLQIDAAPGADIMWGDGGVGSFFIEREALRKRDFSRVLYNWDNG